MQQTCDPDSLSRSIPPTFSDVPDVECGLDAPAVAAALTFNRSSGGFEEEPVLEPVMEHDASWLPTTPDPVQLATRRPAASVEDACREPGIRTLSLCNTKHNSVTGSLAVRPHDTLAVCVLSLALACVAVLFSTRMTSPSKGAAS